MIWRQAGYPVPDSSFPAAFDPESPRRRRRFSSFMSSARASSARFSSSGSAVSWLRWRAIRRHWPTQPSASAGSSRKASRARPGRRRPAGPGRSAPDAPRSAGLQGGIGSLPLTHEGLLGRRVDPLGDQRQGVQKAAAQAGQLGAGDRQGGHVLGQDVQQRRPLEQGPQQRPFLPGAVQVGPGRRAAEPAAKGAGSGPAAAERPPLPRPPGLPAPAGAGGRAGCASRSGRSPARPDRRSRPRAARRRAAGWRGAPACRWACPRSPCSRPRPTGAAPGRGCGGSRRRRGCGSGCRDPRPPAARGSAGSCRRAAAAARARRRALAARRPALSPSKQR